MKGAADGRWGMRHGLALGLAALMLPAGAALGQATSAWVWAGGNWDWNVAAHWNPSVIPNAPTAVAIFTNTDYTVGLTNTLSADVTVNGIVFNDYGAGDAQLLRIQGRQVTFAGTTPFLSNSNDFGGQIIFASTTRVSGVTLTLGGKQGCNNQLQGPFVGDGTLLARDGNWEVMGLNSNFTGRIVVSNFTGNGYLDGRGSGFNAYWYFGDTNEATHIHGNGFVRPLRDGGSTSNAEPFHLYGMNANGSVRFYANTNCTYRGAIALHTNGVVNYSQWFPNAEAPVGARKDFFFNGSVFDDGNARHLFILNDTGGGLSSTGTLSRTSRMVLGGEFRHGGFTYVGNSKNTDGPVEYSGWLELTNANDRLPVGTTLYLGGRTNVGGITIGAEGANGVLILAGSDQELAGLRVLGTGTQSRVIGGVPTNNTLTLAIAAGTTNRFRGILGGAGVNEDNLALTKAGAGTLILSATSTFAGGTTVNAGTLLVNNTSGSGTGPGAVTVNGGTLGGTGTIAGTVTVASGATFAAGNSVGTNTVGSLTLMPGSTFEVEADGTAADQTISLGPVDLGGAELSTVEINPATFTSALILSNATGQITGYFADLGESAPVTIGTATYYIHYRPTYVELNLSPTAVVLHQFGAIAEGAGVVVRWRTASEVRTAGFDLYRKAGDEWVKVNEAPIAAAGAPQGGIGASYAVTDADAAAGGTYEYKLVEIEQDGTRREYGPYERTATAFEMTSPIRATPEGMEIRWLSRAGERYRVLRASELRKPSFEAIAGGLDATPPENVFLDTHAAPLRVYRVELEE